MWRPAIGKLFTGSILQQCVMMERNTPESIIRACFRQIPLRQCRRPQVFPPHHQVRAIKKIVQHRGQLIGGKPSFFAR